MLLPELYLESIGHIHNFHFSNPFSNQLCKLSKYENWCFVMADTKTPVPGDISLSGKIMTKHFEGSGSHSFKNNNSINNNS